MMSAGNLDSASRNLQCAGNHRDELLVRRALDGRCGDPHPQGTVMLSGEAAARGARRNPHHEGDAAFLLKAFDHRTQCRTAQFKGQDSPAAGTATALPPPLGIRGEASGPATLAGVCEDWMCAG